MLVFFLIGLVSFSEKKRDALSYKRQLLCSSAEGHGGRPTVHMVLNHMMKVHLPDYQLKLFI